MKGVIQFVHENLNQSNKDIETETLEESKKDAIKLIELKKDLLGSQPEIPKGQTNESKAIIRPPCSKDSSKEEVNKIDGHPLDR